MKILLAKRLPYIPELNGANKGDRLILEGLAERGHSCRVLAPAGDIASSGAREQFHDELAGRGAILISSSDTVDVFNYNRVEVHVIYDNRHLYPQLVDQIHQFTPTWTLVSEDRSFLCLAAALEASRSRVVYLSHS